MRTSLGVAGLVFFPPPLLPPYLFIDIKEVVTNNVYRVQSEVFRKKILGVHMLPPSTA